VPDYRIYAIKSNNHIEIITSMSPLTSSRAMMTGGLFNRPASSWMPKMLRFGRGRGLSRG
jgi:hypothetical protein